jgi:hypothetical protein
MLRVRYFFHMRKSDRFVEDIEGVELDDIDAVRREAADSTREIMAESLKAGRPIDVISTFEVRDEAGAIVYVLPFAAVLLTALTAPPSIVLEKGAGSSGRGSSPDPSMQH